jgi:predicted DNA binding CopG/RHH family protein
MQQPLLDQQDIHVPQVLQQNAEALFEADRHIAERLGSKHLEAVIQQRFAGGSIAQGTPDHHLEVLRHLVHQMDVRRLNMAWPKA